eukprot:1175980-Pyramimonas_sp.AAC.1
MYSVAVVPRVWRYHIFSLLGNCSRCVGCAALPCICSSVPCRGGGPSHPSWNQDAMLVNAVVVPAPCWHRLHSHPLPRRRCRNWCVVGGLRPTGAGGLWAK